MPKKQDINGTLLKEINETVIRLDERQDAIKTSLDKVVLHVGNMRVDIGKLKIKAGVWGLLGGLIPVLIALLLYFIKGNGG